MSAIDFTRIKKASKLDKYAIDGYIRILQKLLTDNSLYTHAIPSIINHICLCFYYRYDEFDKKCIADAMKLSGNTLNQIRTGMGTAFLTNKISEGQHRWKFQLGHSVDWTLIGIFKTRNKIVLDTYFSRGGFDKGYTYISCDGRLGSETSGDWAGNPRHYGKFKPKEGDIIEMIVDFDSLELSYIVNGIDFGVAFKIEKTEYRAAIAMYYLADSITLLED
eukprot:288520_1